MYLQATYFVPVCNFLLYNIGDFLGRFIAARVPHVPSPLALLLAALRIVFLPLFLFSNLATSDRHLTSVLIPSDAAFCTFMLVLAISNGYLTT